MLILSFYEKRNANYPLPRRRPAVLHHTVLRPNRRRRMVHRDVDKGLVEKEDLLASQLTPNIKKG